MPIVSSQIASLSEQRTGVLVTEVHTDESGYIYNYEYIAAQGIDINQVMTDRAVILSAQLKDTEYSSIINGTKSYLDKTQLTPLEFVTRIRSDYAHSADEQTTKLADFIMNNLDNGTFSDAVAISLLGIDQATWDTYKVKMRAIRSAYNVIKTAQGE